MDSLFSDPRETVTVNFENGATVVLKKYADAGIQEDLDSESTQYRSIENDGGEDPERVAFVHLSNLKYIQKMILSVSLPDGKEITAPVGMATVRRFSRQAYARLLHIINANNPPLGEIYEVLETESKQASEREAEALAIQAVSSETIVVAPVT